METQTANANKAARKDVHTILTEQVILKLQKGIVPWRVPWIEAGLPENLISGNAYTGINRILLASLGYARNVFLTEKQLGEIGGTLIPGERPHVLSYLSSGKKDAKAGDAATVPPEASGAREPMTLRYYTVFNVLQCVIPEAIPIPPVQPDLESLHPTVEIRRKDKTAYYNPLTDYVNVPKESYFGTKEECSYAEFHQLVHATGHHSRLDRKELIQMSEFGYDPFSHEELVAEIGASYLMSHFGVKENFVPTPEYLAGWVKKLEANRWLLFSAAQAAEKAINFLFIGELNKEDMKLE